MRISIHINASDHQVRWGEALRAGLQQHGERILMAGKHQVCLHTDLAVFWSVRHCDALEARKRAGKDYLVMECGYLGERRTTWSSLGFNGLNGRAQAPPPGDPSRADQWRELLQERHGGEYSVIMGQVAGDSSLAELGDFKRWALEARDALRAHDSRPVYYRPHPIAPAAIPGLQVLDGELAEVLAGAWHVATYNSNSGVDAALAGSAVSAWDPGSMAWDMAGHDGRRLELPARSAWLESLAWRQWNQSEFESGAAWQHVANYYS